MLSPVRAIARLYELARHEKPIVSSGVYSTHGASWGRVCDAFMLACTHSED